MMPNQGRSRKFDQLSQWQLAQQEIKQYDLKPIETKVRKIRLARMSKEIKERLENSTPKEIKEQPDPYETLKESRKLGNQFSETNKYTYFSDFYKHKLRRIKKDNSEMKKLKARKSYGNKKSEENKEKIKKLRLIASTRALESVIENDFNADEIYEYEVYYINRFKVKSKMEREEYDLEFQSLIISCLEFEKNHDDVTSVIEYIINTKKSLKEEMKRILMSDELECSKKESQVIPLPQSIKAPDLLIDLKHSTLVLDESDEDSPSYCSERENFNSLTKIIEVKESCTRSYKYSIENTSLISIDKPVDSDLTDESKSSAIVQPSCSQVGEVETIPQVYDYIKKDEPLENPESNEGMFDKLRSKIFEGWNLDANTSSKTKLTHLIPDPLNSGTILDGKFSEDTLKRLITAILTK